MRDAADGCGGCAEKGEDAFVWVLFGDANAGLILPCGIEEWDVGPLACKCIQVDGFKCKKVVDQCSGVWT